MKLKTVKKFVILSLLLCFAACSKQHDAQSNKQNIQLNQMVIKGIGVGPAMSTSIPETVDVVGTVRARTSAMVSTRIPGTVSVLRVREGDRVRKGELLLQLDAQENQATASVAVAAIEEARRAVDEAVARKKLADTTFVRYQNLLNAQVISRQEFDTKQTEQELALQGVARAESRLKQALEASRGAGTLADYTKIVAPISGIITVKQVDLGATVFPAQPLMTIEDNSSYQLELAIPETFIKIVKIGTAVQITLDAIGSSFTAKIAEVVPTADPASRTFNAKINLNNKSIKSGMYGRGTINLGTAAKGLLVPKSGVFERGALTAVWVVDKDSIARMRLVKIGKTSGDKVEVISGLSDGERLVVSGAEKVSDGAKVE